MRRFRGRLVAATIAGCALTVGIIVTGTVAPASASQPESITIVQHSSRGCVTPCTFSMSGTLTDSGTVTLEDEHDGATPSPVVGTAHVIRTMHGQLGSLTVRLQTLLQPTADPMLFHESGQWVIVSGTGAYAGLLGRGDETGTRNFVAQTLDAVYIGDVHL